MGENSTSIEGSQNLGGIKKHMSYSNTSIFWYYIEERSIG